MQTVHPSPEAIRLAMSRIERAMEIHGGDRKAPMDWGIVHRHECRTTACHGGWYALGRLMDHPAIRWRPDETFYKDPGETMMALRRDGTVTHLMYHEGAHMLARDLGFMNAPSCKGWAERNPQIWGTGRSRRVLRMVDARGSRLALRSRPGSANLAETAAFMDGAKRILVFSMAGGTGRSYHADLGCANTERRIHYLLEPGWRADQAIQGLGRTHRTHQASAPLFRPVATNVKGERRFAAAIEAGTFNLGVETARADSLTIAER